MRAVPADKKDNVHFSIEDTGIGIPADRLSRIFETFTQADGSRTRQYGGTGLGTAIARNLVELMGGRIWAESEEGKGSIFHFTLNLPPAHENLEKDDIKKTGAAVENQEEYALFHQEGPKKSLKKDVDKSYLTGLFNKMLPAFQQYNPFDLEPYMKELAEYLPADQINPIINWINRFEMEEAQKEFIQLAKTLEIELGSWNDAR